MSGTEWLVAAGGIAGIALVNWYFFFAQGGVARDAGLADETEERER